MLIGASRASPNGFSSGRTYMLFGSDAGIRPNPFNLGFLNSSTGFAINGVGPDDFSGSFVRRAGDVNGDGIDDILVAAAGASPNGINSGSTYIVFGSRALRPNESI